MVPIENEQEPIREKHRRVHTEGLTEVRIMIIMDTKL